MSVYPTSDEAHEAAAAWCAEMNVNTTTPQGENIARIFACGWLVGCIRGSDAAAQIALQVTTEILAGVR